MRSCYSAEGVELIIKARLVKLASNVIVELSEIRPPALFLHVSSSVFYFAIIMKRSLGKF